MPIPSSPDLLANVLGYAADLNSIPATTPSGSGAFSYQAGFPAITGFPLTAGGVAPSRQDFNGVFNLIGQHLFFLQSGSLYPWSASLDYLVGAHVLGSDGKEYIAQKSSGPNVPGAPAVDPVGDVSGAWLLATLAYGAPIATEKKPGLVQPDGVTTFVTPEGILSAVTLDPSWIGVPRYWRSTNLPPNHCWANGDFVEFADWPELEQVYEAGGFEGMLLPWDADSGTKAANLGKWRPDAAEPTGLYTPNLIDTFLMSWTGGNSQNAGAYNKPGAPNISGYSSWVRELGGSPSGAIVERAGTVNADNGDNTRRYVSIGIDASKSSSIYGASTTIMPSSVNVPVILYLGNSIL